MLVSIGSVELVSIAKGIEVCDAMLKVALVDLLRATTVCSGKYIVLVGGEVAAVETSVRRGIAVGERFVVDSFIIPNVHHQVFPALTGSTYIEELKALGVIETFSAVSAILAADAAVKAAKIELIEIRLANGIGGKAFVTLTGDVSAVEAAISAGEGALEEELLMGTVVIPRPHEGMRSALI